MRIYNRNLTMFNQKMSFFPFIYDVFCVLALTLAWLVYTGVVDASSSSFALTYATTYLGF